MFTKYDDGYVCFWELVHLVFRHESNSSRFIRYPHCEVKGNWIANVFFQGGSLWVPEIIAEELNVWPFFSVFCLVCLFLYIFWNLHNTCTIIHVKNINYLNYRVNNLILKAITQIPISTSNPVIYISLNPILCVVGGSQDSASLVLFSGWSCIWKQKVVGSG